MNYLNIMKNLRTNLAEDSLWITKKELNS
jgi:hypothetical protein